MIWKSFNNIRTVFNYSSSLLELPDSLDTLDLLDTPDSHDDEDEEDDSNSLLLSGGSAAIGVVFFLTSLLSVFCTEIFSGSIVENLLYFLLVLSIFIHIN